MGQNNREVGTVWEHRAAEFLRDSGYVILKQNYRCRIGEIDIVARDGDTLVFVEVKYRKDENMGSPFEAVTISKQRTIRKTAEYYIVSILQQAEVCCRFDVVGITAGKIELIKNAF